MRQINSSLYCIRVDDTSTFTNAVTAGESVGNVIQWFRTIDHTTDSKYDTFDAIDNDTN